ncbi:MAG: hypothetical protein KZQ82_21265, partial [Candidatus Thiodiazotropha sp. (ex Lucinoma annulata)]|nr:hypothetical protein [Candidatus Thiodiazotropha sp. (ex Lucinoma annulata)]
GGASEKPDAPFSGVFAEEGDAHFGRSYVTGLLWALESLAWSDDYLVRVCGILANLAAVDPGGHWANRPASSLTSILLPWYPQTAAEANKRHAAVKSIVCVHPNVAWKLLLALLPKYHSTSGNTCRPKWQFFIPEDWRGGVTNSDQRSDEAFYANLALEQAGIDPVRLVELLEYYFMLHPKFSNFSVALLDRLQSDEVLKLPQEQRFKIWVALTTKITNHRKYADGDAWAVPEDALQELEAVAERLRPIDPEVCHKRLFSRNDFDLYDEKGNWEAQRSHILERRIQALREILDLGGFSQLKVFWRSVESAHEVGNAYGADSESENDDKILPDIMVSEIDADKQFVKSYIWSRFNTNGWGWVDGIDRSTWSTTIKAEFFSSLPFVNEVWGRVTEELADNESAYWVRARAYPDREHLERIDYAIDHLIDNDRSDAAIDCLWHEKLSGGVFSGLGLRALEAFKDSNQVKEYSIGTLFNQLQQDETVDDERLAAMEFKFLDLLNRYGNSQPRTLYRHLAERPEFYCEVIRTIYRSKLKIEEEQEGRPHIDHTKEKYVQHAYVLLR